jgi:hypothetical protein
MCCPNYMVDNQDVTLVSTRPSVRSDKGTADCSKETMLRSAGSATPVQPVSASETGIGAKFMSTISHPRSNR